MNESIEVTGGDTQKYHQISDQKFLWLTATGHFTTDFYNGFLAPLLPIIVVRLSLSLTLAGILLSIFSISNSLLQPISGLIDDRLKRNYLVVIGPLITAIFMGFLGWADHYWTLILILVMSGIGTAMFHPPGAAQVGRLKNKRKGFSMSIFNTAGALGVTVGTLIIIPFISTFGLKATVFTIIFAIIYSIYSQKYFLQEKNIPLGHKHHADIIGAIKPHRWSILTLYLIVVIRATTVLTFGGFIPLYLTSQGNSTMFGGTAVAIFQFFTTIGILIGGYLFDKIGPKKLLILSFIFVLPFGLAFINLPSILGLAFLAIMGFFLSSSTPVNILLGQEMVPTQASFMSSIMMGLAWGVAGLFMTPIGAIADAIGLYWTLTIISSLSVVGLILVYIFRYEERARAV
jgi:FSR family fosmidomycin resistance protein-like MFS transporter